MLKKPSIPVSIAMLLIVSLACVLPGTTAPAPMDPNAINTSVAQTIAARQTQAILNNPVTATFTSTPVTPTLEPTLSPTPEYTATLSAPMLSVSQDTNCRVGPGKLYERIGILLAGESAVIVGREPKGEYWLIRNPENVSEYCWVWGEYATVTGNIYTLVVNPPPPLPDTIFTASFEGLRSCSIWWADFKLTNASDAVFNSITIILKDMKTSIEARLDSNDFVLNQGCGAPATTSSLAGGATITVSSAAFAKNPSGHDMHAAITICTDANQKGTCITRELNFKP